MNHSTQNKTIERTDTTRHGVQYPDAQMDSLADDHQWLPHDEVIDTHVVLLTNYLRKHHVAAFQELQKRVRKLTVLLSVPMEPDRAWEAQWGTLDVIVQKNKMITTNWKHSSGFSENNFIHIPTDTTKQLKRLRPDIILSYEMGVRTLLCAGYRLFNRNCRLVMVGNMSQHIEKERGFLRKSIRNVIKRGCDYFTYNGPSCRRYLKSLNIDDDHLVHFPYCIDGDTVYRGSRPLPDRSVRKMIYCGALSSRKGILQFAKVASQWSQDNPDQQIQFNIAGTGDLEQPLRELSSTGFEINFLGNCDTSELRIAYGDADLCVFPTLADEWGLVPIEAMASGLPVLGSVYAQSVETHVEAGETGWTFRPDDDNEIRTALSDAMQTTPEDLLRMGQSARNVAAEISPTKSAESISELIRSIASEL